MKKNDMIEYIITNVERINEVANYRHPLYIHERVGELLKKDIEEMYSFIKHIVDNELHHYWRIRNQLPPNAWLHLQLIDGDFREKRETNALIKKIKKYKRPFYFKKRELERYLEQIKRRKTA